jgi:hypothetical protein
MRSVSKKGATMRRSGGETGKFLPAQFVGRERDIGQGRLRLASCSRS